GSGACDIYEVYGNVFAENPTGEPLLQAEGRLAIYGNLFLNRHGHAMWIRPHHDRPRQVHVFWNTVVAAGDGIRIDGVGRGATLLVVGNAVFAGKPMRGISRRDKGQQPDNVTDRFEKADVYLVRPFEHPVDLGPRADQLTGSALDVSGFFTFSRWDRDLEGRLRDGTYRGAYHGLSIRPWPIWNRADFPRMGRFPNPSN